MYNSVDDKKEVLETLNNVHESINEKDIDDVMKVTPKKVKEATEHLNNIRRILSTTLALIALKTVLMFSTCTFHGS